QSLPAVTENDRLVPPLADTACPPGLRSNVHTAPATPACVTVDRWSPTEMVPMRCPSARLGATLKPTVASPFPRTAVVNVIQLASVVAVHAHPVETWSSRVSPAAPTVR